MRLTSMDKRVLNACKKETEMSAREILKIADMSSGGGEKILKKLVRLKYIEKRTMSKEEQMKRESKHAKGRYTRNMWKRTDKEEE